MESPQPLPVVLPPGKLTASLRSQVESAVANIIPDGKSGAVLAIAGSEGVTVTVATKIGDDWTLSAEASKKWRGDVSGRIMIVGSW